MRVITGTAKGARLSAPKGMNVRPTLDRVREALFSIIAARVPESRFLDLFAGSGANGIEALSRSASACVFVDSSHTSIHAIHANLEHTRLSDRARCVQATLPRCLMALAETETAFDLIFADPPYKWIEFDKLLERIHSEHLLAYEGLIILEHARATNMPERMRGFVRTRQAHYGDTTLSFYAVESEPPDADPQNSC